MTTHSGQLAADDTAHAAAVAAAIFPIMRRTSPTTLAKLPAASACKGSRAFITDATVAFASAALGTTVVGGGANFCPVFSDGTNWKIG